MTIAMIKILCVVGARPNFIKIAPLWEEMRKYKNIKPILVHTGQHYDYGLSKIFFGELDIPDPHYNLGVGSGTHAEQVGKGVIETEKVILKERPDLVLVVGDANACLVGALAAAKLHIPVAHVEAGLRSFDKRMPEEINRKLTDHLSDFLFCTEPSAVKNLLNEGIAQEKVFYVGNVMIDTLRKSQIPNPKSQITHKFQNPNYQILDRLKVKPREYAVLTLHRTENVDDAKVFNEILSAVSEIQKKIKIIWPVHPRAGRQLKQFSNLAIKQFSNLHLIKPIGYSAMLNLMQNAKFVLTDSGAIQEETTVFNLPCLTLRDNTERPITCEIGTNIVCGTKKENILKETNKILSGKIKVGRIPKYWDGKTSQRIMGIILTKFNKI